MDISEYLYNIVFFTEALELWMRGWNNWSIASFLLLFWSVASRLGFLANIGLIIFAWSIFGMIWGWLLIGVSMIMFVLGLRSLISDQQDD